MSKSDDFKIVSNKEFSKISGILRLPSPLAYEKHFENIFEQLKNCENNIYIIDLTQLNFLNSSGITALARIIIQARQYDQAVEFQANDDSAWQKKSLANLKKLWTGISVNFSNIN